MKNKLFTLIFVLSSSLLLAQANGDIRTSASGLWFDSIWEEYNGGTWSSTGAPSNITTTVTLYHDVSILVSTISINTGGKLVISPTGQLSNDNIAIANNVGINGLLIEASSAGSGQFVNLAAISGTRETYITGSKWHLIGLPIDAISTTTKFDGFYMQQYNETNDTWTWNDEGGFDTSMDLGYGYSVWNATDATVTVSGSFIASDKTIGGLTATGQGYNLLSNPYISGIDYTADWTRTNVNNAIYIWSQSSGAYLSYNVGSSYTIIASQGFFMQATGAGASVVLKASRRTSGSTANPVKVSAAGNIEKARLRIENTTNDYADEVQFEFNAIASLNYDGETDAQKMFGSEESPDLFLLTGDDVNVAIKGLDGTVASTLRLQLRPNVDASYKISTLNFTFDPTTEVLLEDLFTETVMTVDENLEYTFTSLATDVDDRFKIYVTPTANSIDKPIIEDQFNIFGSDSKLHILSSENNYKLMVYNLLGQKLVEQNNLQGFYCSRLFCRFPALTMFWQ